MNVGHRTYRYRIARLVAGAIEYAIYIGPRDRVPAGWSVMVRQVTA